MIRVIGVILKLENLRETKGKLQKIGELPASFYVLPKVYVDKAMLKCFIGPGTYQKHYIHPMLSSSLKP